MTPLGGEHAKGKSSRKIDPLRAPFRVLSFDPLRALSFDLFRSISFVRSPSFDPLRSIPSGRTRKGKSSRKNRTFRGKTFGVKTSLNSQLVGSEPFRSIPSEPFRSIPSEPFRPSPFVRSPPSPFFRSPSFEPFRSIPSGRTRKGGKVLEKIERSEGRQLESNHHSLLNMSARQAIEMFALNGFEAYVFTVCPVMVKPEVILSFVQKGNPSKSATFHRKIVDLIQDYSAAFLRTPRTVTQTPNESEMAAILETLRRFAKDEFRFDLFKKNLQLVFELMAENPEKEKHLIDNASLCKLLNETQNYLHHSNLNSHWEATYSPDKSKVKFTEHPNETVQRKKAKKA